MPTAEKSKPEEERVKNEKQGEESRYPLNEITYFPGGGRLEIGMEEGKQSFKFYHPSGSSIHFDPNGSMRVFVGGETRITTNSKTETVDGNSDTHIKGHSSTSIAQGERKVVVGDSASTTTGDVFVNIIGDSGIAVKGNAVMAVEGNMTMDAGQNFHLRAKGDMTLGTDGAIKLQSAKIEMQPNGDGDPGYAWLKDNTTT